jgi:hypothetical protein
MTEKLDPYAPTLERVLGIKRQLLRAGIPEEQIPMEWLSAIIAATEKWIVTTDEGLSYISELLDFKTRPGDSDKEYALIDNTTQIHHRLKNTQVTFFEGVMVNGRPVPIFDPYAQEFIPPLELDILESSKNKCDGCGIVSHCLKEILEPFSEKLEHLCNYCLTYHEHPRVNDQGGIRICQDCTVKNCQHHPSKVPGF